MSRGKVPYAFKPGHAKMPLDWRPLSFHKRSIMRELWMASENGFLETRIRYLVRDHLDAHTKADRRNLTVGIQELVAEGFITADDRGVTLHTTRQVIAVGVPTDIPRMTHGYPTDDPEVGTSELPTPTKPAKSLQVDLTEERELELDLERDARAHEASRGETKPPEVIAFRRPLPEPPPDLAEVAPALEARKRQLAERICTYLKATGKKASGATPKPDMRHALELAAWCLEPDYQDEWKLDAVGLAKAVCDGLVANERARKEGCPLSWATKNPLQFLGVPPGAPKPESGSRVVQQWQPPEWQREAVRSEQVEISSAIRECLEEDDLAAQSRAFAANLRKRQSPAAPEIEAVAS